MGLCMWLIVVITEFSVSNYIHFVLFFIIFSFRYFDILYYLRLNIIETSQLIRKQCKLLLRHVLL